MCLLLASSWANTVKETSEELIYDEASGRRGREELKQKQGPKRSLRLTIQSPRRTKSPRFASPHERKSY